MFISIVINADTRSGFTNNESTAEHMFDGCRSLDFLIDGVKNKQKFFSGFETETILFIDQHEEIPEDVLRQIRSMVDTLIIRKHDKKFGDRKDYSNFNDLNYLSALFMARGEVVAHFDQDCNAFTSDVSHVQKFIKYLDKYDFVSYPSMCSPKAVDDPTFDYMWASTRFFMCRRETLNFGELMKCLLDYDYLYATYPASRKCHWLEHILGLTAKRGVYYPLIEINHYAIFCWNKYIAGTIGKLNNMDYEEVRKYIEDAGYISYPCDITAKQI